MRSALQVEQVLNPRYTIKMVPPATPVKHFTSPQAAASLKSDELARPVKICPAYNRNSVQGRASEPLPTALAIYEVPELELTSLIHEVGALNTRRVHNLAQQHTEEHSKTHTAFTSGTFYGDETDIDLGCFRQ